MYCIDCGERLNELDKYCPRCGKSLNKAVPSNDNDLKTVSIIIGVIALLSMISIIFMPLAIIEGIIGLIIAICALKKGSNGIGIILNSLALIFSILFISLVVMFFVSIVNEDISQDIQEEYYDHI